MATTTAVVTGANRGIGFEVCRQLARMSMHVILTGRTTADVTVAAQELRATGLNIDGGVMDVASEASVASCQPQRRGRRWASSRPGSLRATASSPSERHRAANPRARTSERKSLPYPSLASNHAAWNALFNGLGPRRHAEADADLAVGHLASRTGVLALVANRMLPLLEEAGVVHDPRLNGLAGCQRRSA
jgi:NAD(P)-dependent dehydrogenase (short-subunit alcohol dehydrogenase family)